MKKKHYSSLLLLLTLPLSAHGFFSQTAREYLPRVVVAAGFVLRGLETRLNPSLVSFPDDTIHTVLEPNDQPEHIKAITSKLGHPPKIGMIYRLSPDGKSYSLSSEIAFACESANEILVSPNLVYKNLPRKEDDLELSDEAEQFLLEHECAHLKHKDDTRAKFANIGIACATPLLLIAYERITSKGFDLVLSRVDTNNSWRPWIQKAKSINQTVALSPFTQSVATLYLQSMYSRRIEKEADVEAARKISNPDEPDAGLNAGIEYLTQVYGKYNTRNAPSGLSALNNRIKYELCSTHPTFKERIENLIRLTSEDNPNRDIWNRSKKIN